MATVEYFKKGTKIYLGGKWREINGMQQRRDGAWAQVFDEVTPPPDPEFPRMYTEFFPQTVVEKMRNPASPYRASGDTGISGQTTSPNQLGLLAACAARFNTSSMRGIWTANHYSFPIPFYDPASYSTVKGVEIPYGMEMYEIAGAAQYAIVQDDDELMDEVIAKLQLQTTQAKVQFLDPDDGATGSGAIWRKSNLVNNSPFFEIGDGVDCWAFIFSCCIPRMKERAMDAEILRIYRWFDRAAAFFAGVTINSNNTWNVKTGTNGGSLQVEFETGLFSNAASIRDSGGDIKNLIWSGGSGTTGLNARSTGAKTHQGTAINSTTWYDATSGAIATTTLHRRMNNRIFDVCSPVGKVGVLLKASGLAEFSGRAEFYRKYMKFLSKMWFAFGISFQGQYSEFERIGTGNLNDMNYAGIAFGAIITDAKLNAMNFGDFEMLNYTTRMGAFEGINGTPINGIGEGSVDKGVAWALVEWKKHLDGTYARYAKNGTIGNSAHRLRSDIPSSWSVIESTCAAMVADYYTKIGHPLAEQIRLMYRRGPGSGLPNYPVDWLPGQTTPSATNRRGTIGGDVPWHWPAKMGSVLLAYGFTEDLPSPYPGIS